MTKHSFMGNSVKERNEKQGKATRQAQTRELSDRVEEMRMGHVCRCLRTSVETYMKREQKSRRAKRLILTAALKKKKQASRWDIDGDRNGRQDVESEGAVSRDPGRKGEMRKKGENEE